MASALLELIWMKFNPPKQTRPSFEGCNIIVTGANTGVGLQCAIKFAELGAERVILAVRSLAKGEAAQKTIESKTGRQGCIEVWHLDMLDYDSVRAFAKRTEGLEHLDVAVLNAGISVMSYEESAYGWERALQTNVLSTTLLSLLLLPKLRASRSSGRDYLPVLELVSSETHEYVKKLRSETAPLEAYNTPKDYFGPSNYGVSKLLLEYAHIGLAKLANNSQTRKPDVLVVSVSPGLTKSEFSRDMTKYWYMAPLLFIFGLLSRTPEEGSRAYISGATLGERGHGRFWTCDEVRKPATMIAGERGERVQAKAWAEIVNALKRDVPEVEQYVRV